MAQTTEEYVFIDRRKNPFVLTDKLVIFKWLPFIGDTGFALYSIYIGLTNKDSGYAFPSLNRLRKFLKKDKKTIIKYNKLLDQYGLITIERVQSKTGDYTSNRYYINEVPDIPPELVEKYETIRLIEHQPKKSPIKETVEGGSGIIPPPGGKCDQGGSGIIPPRSGTIPPPVVESFHPNKTNIKDNKLKNLSPGERHPVVPAESVFSSIPNDVLGKLFSKYSEKRVLAAIGALDHVYSGLPGKVRSPLALLRTALEDGFEPAQLKESDTDDVIGSAEGQSIQDEKWLKIREQNRLLPESVRAGWNDFMERFSGNVSKQVFETWFNPLVPIDLQGGVLLVDASSRRIADYIEGKWLGAIREIVKGRTYPFNDIRLVVTGGRK